VGLLVYNHMPRSLLALITNEPLTWDDAEAKQDHPLRNLYKPPSALVLSLTQTTTISGFETLLHRVVLSNHYSLPHTISPMSTANSLKRLVVVPGG
jgi:hypothetical protein